MFEKFKKKWKEKSLLSKISDLVFIILLVALIFPQGRMAIGGFVNKIKAKVDNPDILDNEIQLTDSDFNWIMKNADNETVNLKQSKGKVIFINLWATWCPPCVGEMPEIESLYQKYKDNDNVEFYLISKENIDQIEKFRTKKSYTFPVYQSLQNTPSVFYSQSIPTTFVISKDKKIIIRKIGASNWGGEKMIKIVEKLINEVK